LSLATCFANDLYGEAARRKINIQSVAAIVYDEFRQKGQPASSISYMADIQSTHLKNEISVLINHVYKVAELHNPLRKGIYVSLLASV
jgi:hypothetical protein